MKKIKYLIFILLLIIPSMVSASGSITPSVRNLTINKGNSASFTITANNAAGKIDISTSNNAVVTINKTSEWLENNSITVTVTGVSAGNANIVVRLTDAATFDEEELTGSYTISVTVQEPKTNTTNNNQSSSKTTITNNLSTNNKIEYIKVEGYDLTKIDDNNYELEVSHGVDKILLECKSIDSKAIVSGTGEKELIDGLNSFEVIVTSESLSKNIIKINVTRKDSYYLDDLSDAIKLDNVVINLKNEDKLTKEELQVIKDNEKIVSLNYYDDNKNLLYSWIIDGNELDNICEFSPIVNFSTDNKDEIDKLSNYALGKYINFNSDEKLPNGIKLKLYVKDIFNDNSLVNIYCYDNNNLDKQFNDIKVEEGYIEFNINKCKDYFITMSNINTIEENTSEINIFLIMSIIEFILIIIILILDYFKVNPILKIRK